LANFNVRQIRDFEPIGMMECRNRGIMVMVFRSGRIAVRWASEGDVISLKFEKGPFSTFDTQYSNIPVFHVAHRK
jgi:hypothetical protein